MRVQIVDTVTSLNSAGIPADVLPVRDWTHGQLDASGGIAEPVRVEEGAGGRPVRYVSGAMAQNSVGRWVNVQSVSGLIANAEIQQVDHKESATDATSYTFAGTILGAAASNRTIVVQVGGRAAGVLNVIDVTLDGVSMVEKHVAKNEFAGNTTVVATYQLPWPEGTTAELKVFFSATSSRMGASILRGINLSDTLVDFTHALGNTAGDDMAVQLNEEAGGAVAAYELFSKENSTIGFRHSGGCRASPTTLSGGAISVTNFQGAGTWTGVPKTLPDVNIEQGAAGPQVLVALSWSKASAPLASLEFVPVNLRNSVMVGAAPGTVIGSFVGAQSFEVLTWIDKFVASGVDLITTASPDFEGPIIAGGDADLTYGIGWYDVQCRVLRDDGQTVVFVVRVRPRYAKIEPTGAGVVTPIEIDVTNSAAVRAALSSPVNGRHLKFVGVGVASADSNSTIVTASDMTFEGTPRAIILRDYGPQVRAPSRNQIWKNLALRVGADVAGRTPGARDCISFEGGDTILVDHVSVSWGIDELVGFLKLGGKLGARRVHFNRVHWAEPLFTATPATHPEGVHPYGCLVADQLMDVVFTFNLWNGVPKRCPEIGQTRGVLSQNNIVCHSALGGFCVSSPLSTSPSNDLGITAIHRGNLHLPRPSGVSTPTQVRAQAIRLARIGSGSEIYEADNHFLQWDDVGGVYTFNDDPLIRAQHVGLDGNSTLASMVDELPFIPADYGYQVCTTAQNREDLFNSIVNDVGDGSAISQRQIEDFMNFTFTIVNNPDDVGGWDVSEPV